MQLGEVTIREGRNSTILHAIMVFGPGITVWANRATGASDMPLVRRYRYAHEQ